jgi:hypothetical protein
MALIRCPGCKLDTSDSLDTCPYCRAPLKGPPARPVSPPAAGSVAESGVTSDVPHRRGSFSPKPSRSRFVKTVVGLALLACAIVVPGGVAIALIGLLGYWVLFMRQGTTSRVQAEVLRRLAERGRAEVRRSGADRPLSALSRIEAELRKSSARRRP